MRVWVRTYVCYSLRLLADSQILVMISRFTVIPCDAWTADALEISGNSDEKIKIYADESNVQHFYQIAEWMDLVHVNLWICEITDERK